ncbi:DEAD/DEAH box helicase [Actinomycetaceae bacterium TAE3-ERU4]|nr:DEAD/DEAH box helicase [Actinomycetaceae bacterium TAE3-ERU4]
MKGRELPVLEIPTWSRRILSALDDEGFAAKFSWSVLTQAKISLSAGRVLSMRVVSDPDASHLKIRSDQLGSGKLVVCSLEIYPNATIYSQCTCRVHRQCAHGAAMVMILQNQARTEAKGDWQSIFSAITSQRQSQSKCDAARKLAIYLRQTDAGITLEPLLLMGNVIRPGRVSWADLREQLSGKSEYDLTQLRLLVSLADMAQSVGFKYGAGLSLEMLRSGVEKRFQDCLETGIRIFDSLGELTYSKQKARLVLQVDDELSLSKESKESSLKHGDYNAGMGLLVSLKALASTGENPHLEVVFPLAIDYTKRILYFLSNDDEWSPAQTLLKKSLVIPAEEVFDFELYLLRNLPALEIISSTGWQLSDKLEWGWGIFPVYSSRRFPEKNDEEATGIPEFISFKRLCGIRQDLRPNLDLTHEELEMSRHLLRELLQESELSISEAGDILNYNFSLSEIFSVFPLLRESVEKRGEHLVIDERLNEFRFITTEPEIKVNLDNSDNDWFKLRISVFIAGEEISVKELIKALTVGQKYYRSPGGKVINLMINSLSRLRLAVEEAQELKEKDSLAGIYKINRYQISLLEDIEEVLSSDDEAELWRQKLKNMTSGDLAPQIVCEFPLREYQLTGYRWLYGLASRGFGGVLADDMGLGKTLQVLSLVASLSKDNKMPVLVISPTSLLGVWHGEALKFFPHLRVKVLNRTEKKSPQDYRNLEDFDLIVTSYALSRIESEYHSNFGYSGIILDEAQAVKNPQAAVHRAIKHMQAGWKIAITGTPVENSVMDIWAIMQIVCPGLLPRQKVFYARYGRAIDQEHDSQVVEDLLKRVRPFLLRRSKEMVAADLPDKTEQIITIPLSSRHKRIYDRYLARERQRILGLIGDVKANRFQILSALTKLRQLALDPALLDADEYDEVGSEKIEFLISELASLIQRGHKILVFSQFTSFLKRVSARLEKESISHAYMDGTTSNRNQIITDFREGNKRVFLISLKAGGTGLTLTEADYVFLLDPWWNPAAEAQAVDRAHRIGQTKKVNVYRLISADTIEESVQVLQLRKKEVISAITDGVSTENPNNSGSTLNATDIEQLLS